MRRVLPVLVLASLVLAGCGTRRQQGDPGGTQVRFDVQLDRDFVAEMDRRQARVGLGVGAGVGSGGFRGVGLGMGLSFSSTRVDLLGGFGPGQAQLFRVPLHWGGNDIVLPLNQGREVTLTVAASGGREGWESIGSFVVAGVEPLVRVRLTGAGGSVEVVEPAADPADDAL